MAKWSLAKTNVTLERVSAKYLLEEVRVMYLGGCLHWTMLGRRLG